MHYCTLASEAAGAQGAPALGACGGQAPSDLFKISSCLARATWRGCAPSLLLRRRRGVFQGRHGVWSVDELPPHRAQVAHVGYAQKYIVRLRLQRLVLLLYDVRRSSVVCRIAQHWVVPAKEA